MPSHAAAAADEVAVAAAAWHVAAEVEAWHAVGAVAEHADQAWVEHERPPCRDPRHVPLAVCRTSRGVAAAAHAPAVRALAGLAKVDFPPPAADEDRRAAESMPAAAAILRVVDAPAPAVLVAPVLGLAALDASAVGRPARVVEIWRVAAALVDRPRVN